MLAGTTGGNEFQATNGALNVLSGGTFNWQGGVIDSKMAVGSENAGSVFTIRSGILNFKRAMANPANNVQFRAVFNTLDIIGFKIFGGKATWSDTPVTNFLGYEPIQMIEPLVGGGTPNTGFFEVRDYAGRGNVQGCYVFKQQQ